MRIKRRDLLRLGAGAVAAPFVRRISPAFAALPPFPNLSASDGLLLTPMDADYATYLPAFNERTIVPPQLRAMCLTPTGVQVMVNWARDNAVPFALRSGGHCYEDFSESASVVIDTRMMNAVNVDTTNQVVTVGAGASLGAVYMALQDTGFAIAAGSCPTVGVAGHLLGGGFGFLGRAYGLASDNLQSISVVDPTGNIVTADANNNTDLYWASRGGGGGTFGAATQFVLGLIPIGNVQVFKVTWILPQARAANVFKAWQSWAPNAPNAITTFCRVTKTSAGHIEVHCAGQSIGTATALRNQLSNLTSVETPTDALEIETLSFWGSVVHFAGGFDYTSDYFKGKSDYLTSPMSDDGIATLMGPLLTTTITAICDSYGGAVDAIGAQDTAFAHRAGTLYSIQYASTWDDPSITSARLADMTAFYQALRPYVSGSAYVNYCDIDLVNWQQAYWGQNYARLQAIKSAFDPQNLFTHAQSVQ